MNDAYLILENGTVFKGRAFGYETQTVGELVFTTSMTGYLETLADPGYYGQIVLQTFPLIGNYGVIPPEFGIGPAHLRAYIVRDWCQEPSNFRSEGNLDSFLRKIKVPGLYDIDTRALTRLLRENGVMNAMISKTPELSEEQWAKLREYRITDAVSSTCSANAECRMQSAKTSSIQSDIECEIGDKSSKFNIAVWDFGNSGKLTDMLLARGATPYIVDFTASADDLLAQNPDGVALSCGPGDPSENTRIIEEIKNLCDKNIPIFGVGLGHQMLAIAHGAKTIKLPFGHRGANQPVSELATNHVFATSQNHGYAVAPDSLPDATRMIYSNTNDGTCEGIEYTNIPAFSVQFDPTDEIFSKFFAHIKTN